MLEPFLPPGSDMMVMLGLGAVFCPLVGYSWLKSARRRREAQRQRELEAIRSRGA